MNHASLPVEIIQYILYQSMTRILASGFTQERCEHLAKIHPAHVDTVPDATAPYNAILLPLTEDADENHQQLLSLRNQSTTFTAWYLFYNDRDALLLALEAAALVPYAAWQYSGPSLIYQDSATLDAPAGVVMAISGDYDPVDHAQSVLEESRNVGWAYEILINTPEETLPTIEMRGALAAEKLNCLNHYDQNGNPDDRVNRLARALDEFYKVTTYTPYEVGPHIVMATFWERLGVPDMGRRYMASHHYIHKSAELAKLKERFTIDVPAQIPQAPPDWSGKPVKILYLLHTQSDFGSDTLYEGLCELLGDDAVVEYPWKPTLHGQDPEKAFGYPCVYKRGGEAMDLEAVCTALQRGDFDMVLYSDTIMTQHQEDMQRIIQAAKGLPLFLIDMWDQCGNYFNDIQTYIGAEEVWGQFKREKLVGVDYGPNTIAMPFAFVDNNTLPILWEQRGELFFWAGKFQAGTRRLTLEFLHKVFNLDPNRKLPPDEYAQAIAHARMGLSLFGNGFDTVRYWELPAHGCCMFSETLPIEIPLNFRDGREAIFFNDLEDMEQKILYYLDHEDEVRRIAEAGYAHFKRHHTATARARQFLGYTEALIQQRRQ